MSTKAAGESSREAPVAAAAVPELEEEKKRRWPWWGWALLAVVVVGGGVYWRARSRPVDPATQFETARVEPRKLVSKVTATGTLSALVTVQVGSQVSGRIQEILVDYNSPVKKGQLIARIDPQLVQAALDRAKANLMAARANVTKAKVEADNARKQAERSKVLREKQFIAQADLDAAESTAQSAQAQVMASEGALAQAQAAMSEAEVNLRYTSIQSPTDGIVISRSVDVGQTVAASLQAPTLFTIAEDLRKMQVDTSVAEADVGRLEPGMRATFTVDAWPGVPFEGTVRQIRNAAQTVQNVVTYDAVIDVSNPELKLKPGMTANVTFITGQKDQALSVPNAALRFKPQLPEGAGATSGAQGAAGAMAGGPPRGGGAVGARPGNAGNGGTGMTDARPADGSREVWVLREGHPRVAPVRVHTGMTDGSYTEVVDGDLREGDAVLTGLAAGAATTASGSGGAPGAAPGGMGGGRPPMRRGLF